VCTVSVVPFSDGVRLLCNRDERRDRTPARPPNLIRCGDRTAIVPVDPDGGGSWIGVNDAGLAIVLINRPAGRRSTGRESRGLIVTRLLGESSLEGCASAAATVDAGGYQPFRLLAVQRGRALLADADGGRVCLRAFDLSQPRMLTSSSVDADATAAFRSEHFRTIVLAARSDRAAAQQQFHRQQDPDRPSVSVLMSRAEARTVSRTTVDLGPRAAHFLYEPLDASGGPVRCNLRF
jgi:Transport and Golgi organisation 2